MDGDNNELVEPKLSRDEIIALIKDNLKIEAKTDYRYSTGSVEITLYWNDEYISSASFDK